MQQLPLISGSDPTRNLDALFVNAPLRDYDQRPRTNDYTLPVLGMAYIATYAKQAGYNVGVLDAEAHGLGITETAAVVNAAAPRWAAMNLLAPTYEMSARIASHRGGVPHLGNVEVADQRDRVSGEASHLVDEGVLGALAVGEDDRCGPRVPSASSRRFRNGSSACGPSHASSPCAAPCRSAMIISPGSESLSAAAMSSLVRIGQSRTVEIHSACPAAPGIHGLLHPR